MVIWNARTLKNGQAMMTRGRVLVWFSCGAASTVAAKLAIDKYKGEHVEVIYCDTLKYEHPDNVRFIHEVERWLGVPVILLRHWKYADIMAVFEGERYIVGPSGAPCTRALKRNVRIRYEWPEDLHVFGYTAEEGTRIAEFESENPNLWVDWILREHGVTKKDCYRIMRAAGISIPAMYLLGYHNNNCIGCVKGGKGYWNKIRRDFPESFWRMARLERIIGACILGDVYLDELPPSAGRFEDEDIECGVGCHKPSLSLRASASPRENSSPLPPLPPVQNPEPA